VELHDLFVSGETPEIPFSAALGFPLLSAFRCARLSAALGFPLRSAFRCARLSAALG